MVALIERNSRGLMQEQQLNNILFDELRPGDSASITRPIVSCENGLCTMVTGETAPAPAPAAPEAAGERIEQGIWTMALVAAVIGTRLPGPGTICLGHDVRFTRPAAAGEIITASVEVREKLADGRTVLLGTRCTDQSGATVMTGSARVLAPLSRISWQAAEPRPGSRYDAFVRRAAELPPVRAAIVHPCSRAAILGAAEVRDAGLLEPLLVGPEARIRATAAEAGVSLEGMAIEPVEHSHAAAARAVEMAVAGQVAILVKGSLHSDELLGAVVAKTSGLRTERRISHVFAMDVPAYDKPLIVTDAAINILPTLEQKRDICQNAVDLLRLLGVETPRVAVLAAVETVDPKMPATLDAAALTVMAARGQITGALVDGPLAFDNAISLEAAATKQIASPVAGRADILLVPDLEAGNMLAKQLIYFAGATAAGLVLGARVPIVLTSRADPLTARIASAALARLVVHRKAGGLP